MLETTKLSKQTKLSPNRGRVGTFEAATCSFDRGAYGEEHKVKKPITTSSKLERSSAPISATAA